MSRGNHIRALGGLIATLVCLIALPGSALAEPRLEVEIGHTPSSMPRNDEQMAYLVDVENTASTSPSIGDTLTCDGVPAEWGGTKEWGGQPREKLSFTYQWLRNGMPIAGASGSIPKGGPRPTYTVVADDAGRVIQCQIKGTLEATNPAENMAYLAESHPGLAIAPLPSPLPPLATDLELMRPSMSGEPVVGNQLQCPAPKSWSGSPSWTFAWLRNGVEIATGPTYVVQASDEGANLQCLAKATTGAGEAPNGGAGIVASYRRSVGTLPEGITVSPFIQSPPSEVPQIEFASSTAGEVRLELELPPGGAETRVFKVKKAPESGALDWDSCTTREPLGPTPGKAICKTTKAIGPGQRMQRVEVLTALGPLAPDPSVAKATISGGGSATDSAEDEFHFDAPTPFGIKSFATEVLDALGADYTKAGGHPTSASASFQLTGRRGGEGQLLQVEFMKNIVTDVPPGFIGNPQALPEGKACKDTDAVQEDDFDSPTCPRGSIVGLADVVLGISGEPSGDLQSDYPIYAIEPERGAPAQFEFYLKSQGTLVTLTPRLRAAEGYAIRVETPALAKTPTLFAVSATLCGFGVNVQDPVANYHKDAPEATGCKPSTQGGVEPANPKPFLTNPTRCTGTPPVTKLAVDSWDNPGRLNPDGTPDYSDPDWQVSEAVSPEVTECENVPFDPEIEFEPGGKRADTPTGLDVELTMPTDGLEDPDEIAEGHLKKAVVTLPKGMAVNPSAADGLGACSSAQIGLGTDSPVKCPDSSKIGTAEVKTPILEETLEGSVYLAKQNDNPFDSLLALYLVIESKERGILIKLAGKVDADPVSGQLKTTFDNNPQAPVSSIELHFPGGNRAPLLSPPKCGTYEITSQLYSWTSPSEAETSTSTFRVTQGPGGASCPNGSLKTKLDAGVQNPIAGSTSPFLLGLSREDGSQRIDGLQMDLPPGLTAYLKGIPYCPDASLASVSGAIGSGQSQIDKPSCPSASQIGSVSVGAGGGASPFYVNTGKVYLAGPYKGAPLSIAVIAPAVAGPFDLGSVVVRNAAYVNPVSTQITVKADPIPTILHGIPVDVRDIRVSINRPDFTLAPTSCEPMAVGAEVDGESGGTAKLSSRFQVGACDRLGFQPKLSLRLKGGTKRGANPKLIATVQAREGDANIGALSVRLPRSAFLDQAHIKTICTRVQWAADACPPGSVYGRIQVTTPLLDYALSGNVYLRSSDNKLPDLVSDLRGPANQPIRVEFSGRTDSVKGALRNTFDFVPDAPFTTARLELFGGKRGLVVNSRNICAGTFKATVQMDGQNGAVWDTKPVVGNDCAKAKRKRGKRRG